jgi:hypothetical protein
MDATRRDINDDSESESCNIGKKSMKKVIFTDSSCEN